MLKKEKKKSAQPKCWTRKKNSHFKKEHRMRFHYRHVSEGNLYASFILHLVLRSIVCCHTNSDTLFCFHLSMWYVSKLCTLHLCPPLFISRIAFEDESKYTGFYLSRAHVHCQKGKVPLRIHCIECRFHSSVSYIFSCRFFVFLLFFTSLSDFVRSNNFFFFSRQHRITWKWSSIYFHLLWDLDCSNRSWTLSNFNRDSQPIPTLEHAPRADSHFLNE